MQITVTFASLNEFYANMKPGFLAAPESCIMHEPVPPKTEQPESSAGANQDAAPPRNPWEAPKPASVPSGTPKKPNPEPAQEAREAKDETIDEKYRIKVRKQLAALNRSKGYNRAAELICALTGKDKLTEVALADLPKLMAAAGEELHAG